MISINYYIFNPLSHNDKDYFVVNFTLLVLLLSIQRQLYKLLFSAIRLSAICKQYYVMDFSSEAHL